MNFERLYVALRALQPELTDELVVRLLHELVFSKDLQRQRLMMIMSFIDNDPKLYDQRLNLERGDSKCEMIIEELVLKVVG